MATYTGIKAILTEFKNRMIKTKVSSATNADEATHAVSADSATSATNADRATNADKVDGYHVGTSYPALVPITACSLGSPGYIKLANGLVIQWVTVNWTEAHEVNTSVSLSQITTLYGVSISAISRDHSNLNGAVSSHYFVPSAKRLAFLIFGHDKNDRFIGAKIVAIGI